jgi:hypothetical protein
MTSATYGILVDTTAHDSERALQWAARVSAGAVPS